MATMVCRGLQSCLDSHLVDQRTSLLVKLSSPFEFPLKPLLSDHSLAGKDELFAGKNGDSDEKIYVHPLSKTSLSEKSLKLCTENLGNESGTDIIESIIFSPEMGSGNLQKREKMKSQFHGAKKVNSQNFPPPLTTIRESESFRVRPHREAGRLVIAAVRTPARESWFRAERSHGRLRLCFSKPEEVDEEEGNENVNGRDEEEMQVDREGVEDDNEIINLAAS